MSIPHPYHVNGFEPDSAPLKESEDMYQVGERLARLEAQSEAATEARTRMEKAVERVDDNVASLGSKIDKVILGLARKEGGSAVGENLWLKLVALSGVAMSAAALWLKK